MELFTLARKADDKGNAEYQIGGNVNLMQAAQMIIEVLVSAAREEGRQQAIKEIKELKAPKAKDSKAAGNDG